MWTLRGSHLIVLSLMLCAGAFHAVAQGQPALNAGGIVNAADYSLELSPGAIFTVFGRNLAAATVSASTLPLPETLGGVSVELVSGAEVRKARLFFVSPGQVNAQMPFACLAGDVRVRVRNGGGLSNEGTVRLKAHSPRLFTMSLDGKGQPALLHADYRLVSPAAPALPGETLLLYLTGLGAVTPAGRDGEGGGDGSAAAPLNRTSQAAEVTVAGTNAEVTFSGLAPGYPGLYQVNFTVPAGTPAGLQALRVALGRDASQAGVNAAIGELGNPVATQEMTASGGVVRAGALTLQAHPGAFRTNSTVNVYRAAALPAAFADSWLIRGLTWPPAGAMTFSVDAPRAPRGKASLRIRLLGAPGIPEGDLLLPAEVQGTRVTATLGAALLPTLAREGPAADSYTLHGFSLVLTIEDSEVGYCRGRESLFAFVIPPERFDTIDQQALCTLYTYLERAHGLLQGNLKLDMTRRKWPMAIQFLELEREWPPVIDDQSVSQTSRTYPGIDSSVQLNLKTWNTVAAKTIEIAMHRNLMTVMLGVYAPPVASEDEPLFWLRSALRTWFERWPVGGIPLGVARDFDFHLRGGLECENCDVKSLERHGAGAAQFLEFLMLGSPSQSIGLLISLLGSYPDDPVGALKEMIRVYHRSTIEQKWRDFCEQWMAGRVYSFGSPPVVFPTPQMIAGTEEREVIFFSSDQEKVLRLWQADDLSARLYELRLPQLPGRTKLRLSLGPANDETAGFLYSLEPDGKWTRLASFRGSTAVDDVKPLRNAGARLYLLVANGRAVAPYIGTHTVELTAELIPLWYVTTASNQLSIGVQGPYLCAASPAGTCLPPIPIISTTGDTLPAGVKTEAGWQGNTYLARRRYTFSNTEYTLEISAGLSADGETIVTASVRNVEQRLDGTWNRTLEFTVRDVPFFRPGLNAYYYEITGSEALSRVSRFSFREINQGRTVWDVTGVRWDGTSTTQPRIYVDFAGAPW